MIKNPRVELNIGGEKIPGLAAQVTDDGLRRRILDMRDSPPQMERVVFEIKPRN
jgi:hypothetical protein